MLSICSRTMKIILLFIFGATLSMRGSELLLDSIHIGEDMDLSGPFACELDDGQLFMSHLIGGVNRFDFSEDKFVPIDVPEMQY